jgi:hypothetical protein
MTGKKTSDFRKLTLSKLDAREIIVRSLGYVNVEIEENSWKTLKFYLGVDSFCNYFILTRFIYRRRIRLCD